MAWGRDAELERRVSELETQVAQLRAELASLRAGQPGPVRIDTLPVVAESSPLLLAQGGELRNADAVLSLMRRGNRIAAIKEIRDQTGLGLKEAVDAYAELERMR